MLKVQNHEDITRIMLGRDVQGAVCYWVATYHRVLALPLEKLTLFTSIGQMYDDGKGSIRRYLRYLDDLREKVQECRAQGLTAEAVRDRLFGRESQLESLTGCHYSILNLIR